MRRAGDELGHGIRAFRTAMGQIPGYGRMACQRPGKRSPESRVVDPAEKTNLEALQKKQAVKGKVVYINPIQGH